MKQVRNINLYGWGLGLLLALAACSDEETNLAPQEGNATMTFRLSTRADEEGAASTEQHTHLYVAERLSEHSGIDEDNPMSGTEIPLYCDKDFTIEGNEYSVTNLLGQWYKFAFVCVPFADMLNPVTGNDFNTYYIDYEPALEAQAELNNSVDQDLAVYRKIIDRWAIANSILEEDVELTRVTGQLIMDMGKVADQFPEQPKSITVTLNDIPTSFYLRDYAMDSVIVKGKATDGKTFTWTVSEEDWNNNRRQEFAIALLPATLTASVTINYGEGSEAATYTLQNDNGEPIVIKKNTRTIVRFNGLHTNEFEVRYAGFADGNDAVVGVDDDKWNGNQLNKGDN